MAEEVAEEVAELAALLVLGRLATWLRSAPNAFRLLAQGIPFLPGFEGVSAEPFGSQTCLGYQAFRSPFFVGTQAIQLRFRCWS